MSIPIPSVNVTDLIINHLDLGSISLKSISLEGIKDFSYVYHLYVLFCVMFVFVVFQTICIGFICHLIYRERNRYRYLHKINQILIE